MKRIAMLALVLSACTGTYYPYSSSQPQYASSTTQSTSQSPDGTMSSSTTTTTFESNTQQPMPPAQPAAYEEPPPPPPPPSGPQGTDGRCDRRDTPNMCVALGVILDIGDILAQAENGSCRQASKSLNRYADQHPREIDTLIRLDQLESRKRIEKFSQRHQGTAGVVISRAMELDARCEGDDKLDRALRRVGFSGLIGSPAM